MHADADTGVDITTARHSIWQLLAWSPRSSRSARIDHQFPGDFSPWARAKTLWGCLKRLVTLLGTPKLIWFIVASVGSV